MVSSKSAQLRVNQAFFHFQIGFECLAIRILVLGATNIERFFHNICLLKPSSHFIFCEWNNEAFLFIQMQLLTVIHVGSSKADDCQLFWFITCVLLKTSREDVNRKLNITHKFNDRNVVILLVALVVGMKRNFLIESKALCWRLCVPQKSSP